MPLAIVVILLALSITLFGCKVDDEIAANQENIAKLQVSLDGLDSRVNQINATLDGKIESELASLRVALETSDLDVIRDMTGQVAALSSTITTVNTDLSNRIDALAEADTALETALSADIDTANQALTDAKTALENADTALGTRVTALETAKTQIDTALATLNDADATAGDRLTALETAKTALENADTALDARIDDLETALSDLEDALDDLEESLVDADAALSDRITALETAKTALENADAAIADRVTALETAKTQLETALATCALKSDLDAAVERIAALEQTNVSIEANALQAAISDIQDVLKGEGETIDSRFVALETTLSNIQTALSDVQDSYAKAADVADAIDALRGELEIVEGKTDMAGLDARITALEGKATTLETGVAALVARFDAFNGEEAREGKEDYVYELVMAYANFDHTMADGRIVAKNALVTYAHMEETDAEALLNDIFDDVYESWTHEMFGFLHRGNALIILAEDLEQAEAYKDEYVDRLSSYAYYVRFEVEKRIRKYVVSSYTNIPTATTPNSKTTVLDAMEAIVFVQSDADDMATANDVKEYYDGLIAELDLWLSRAANLDAIYSDLADAKAAIDALNNVYSTAYITSEQVTALKTSLEEVVDDDNYLTAETKEDANAQYEADSAALELIVAQATAYNDLMKYAADKVAEVNALTYITDQEKIDFAAEINAVPDLDNYHDALEDQDAIDAQLEEDKTAIDTIRAKIDYYNLARKHAAEGKAEVDAIASGITGGEQGEKATVNGLIDAAVSAYSVYASKEITETEENTDEAVDLLEADCAAIDLLVLAAKTYAADVDYANAYIAAITDTETGLKELAKETDNMFSITTAISQVPELCDYTGVESEEALTTLQTDNRTAMDLTDSQAIAYDTLLVYEVAKVALVNDMGYLTSDEKTTVIGMLNAVSVFANYYPDLAKDNIAGQLDADKGLIDDIIYKVTNYNAAKKYAHDQKESYGDTYNDEAYLAEKTLVETRIDAVSTLNAYTSAVAYEDTEDPTQSKTMEEVVDAMLAADKVKIDVLVQRLATYKALYDYDAAKDAAIDALTSGHDNAANECDVNHGVFTSTDKGLFKAKYAAYVDSFDTLMDAQNFATVAQVTTYETNAKAYIDLVVYSATTFNSIICKVADIEDAIGKLSNFDATTANVYKSRFADYAVYATHEANTNTTTEEKQPFATTTEYDTYKTAVFTLVGDTMSIATSENTLIGSINTNKSNVDAKRTAGYITEAEQTYLKAVLDDIYTTYTNAEVEDKDIAAANATNGTNEANAVSAICDTIKAIDDAQKLLNETTIPTYVANLFETFRNDYYEAVYQDYMVVWNKFYSNEAYSNDIIELLTQDSEYTEPVVVDADHAYMVTIQTKAIQTEFHYDLPTEFTYAKFAEFRTMLNSQDVPGRMIVLSGWVEADYDGDDVADGGIYALMAKAFDELDSQRLEKARVAYGEAGLLAAKFNAYKDACSAKEAELRYEYNTKRTYIASSNAKRTADVIKAYNEACLKFAKIRYLYELQNYRDELLPTATTNNKVADLNVAYDNIVNVINAAATEADIVDNFDSYKAQLDAAIEVESQGL